MSWYISVMKNYAQFSGRARRKEYWMFHLMLVLIWFVLSILMLAVNYFIPYSLTDSNSMSGGIMTYFVYIFGIAHFVPSIALAVRRLHDIGKSGWFYFIMYIPVVGGIWFLILMCMDSNPGENTYGANPKEV